MELEQLRQLDAIAREGTMSAAARVLHISQPALSRSLGRLETELGLQLFDRAGRRLVLNDVGRVALEHARQLLRDEQAMRGALEDLARRTRALRVVTDAPFLAARPPGRAVVQIHDAMARATFHLLVRSDGRREAVDVFAWVSDRWKGDGARPGIPAA